MQQRLVHSLYQEANVAPDQVEYIEAHGTGTKVSVSIFLLLVLLLARCSGNVRCAPCLSLHAGWGPAGGQWDRWCLLSVKAGASAHWLHQVQHGSSRTSLRSSCTGKGERPKLPVVSKVIRVSAFEHESSHEPCRTQMRPETSNAAGGLTLSLCWSWFLLLQRNPFTEPGS